MQKISFSKIFMNFCLLLAVMLTVAVGSIQAADVYFDSTTGLIYFDEAGFWVGGVAPTTGDNVYFTADDSTDYPSKYYRYEYNGSSYPLPYFNSLLVENTGGGTMTLSSSGTYPNGRLSSSSTTIGDTGKGIFNQRSGTHSVTNYLYLGKNGGGEGTYNLTGGSLESYRLYVGTGGTGTFTHSSGSVNTTSLSVGDGYYSSGSYELSGSSSSLEASNETIGRYGTGTFTHNDGVNRVTGYLSLGKSYTITVYGSDITYHGNGTYNMAGGRLEATDSGFNMYVADDKKSYGTVNLTGGTMDLGAGNLYLGYGDSAHGTFTQSGGVLSAAVLQVGGSSWSGGYGGYELSDTGVVHAGDETVDFRGTFSQSGGEHTVAGLLTMDSGGGFYMSGGSLAAADDGFNLDNHGVFTHSGGNVDLGSGSLNVYSHYELSGTAVLVAHDEYLGGSDSTAFIQSGGDHYIASSLSIGDGGSYSMTGGDIAAAAGAFSMYCGDNGSGIFSQEDGSVNLGTDADESFLRLGNNSGSSGTYELSGGSLAAYDENIGYNGSGTFTQTGGSNTLAGSLVIATNEGSSGSYFLNDGVLSVSDIIVNANGSFTQSGGTVSAGSVLNNHGYFSQTGGTFAGHLHLFEEGSFSLPTEFTAGNGITNDDTLSIYSGRMVTVNGLGLENNNKLYLSLGTLTGDGLLSNNGLMTASGTIAGTGGLENNAYLIQTGDLTVSNAGAFVNNMFFNLGEEDFLSLEGGNLQNNGVMTMNNSFVTGSAQLLNQSGGTLRGEGLILTSFANEGRLLVSRSTAVAGGFVNSGEVELADASAYLSGGAIDNQGTVHGCGQVGNDLNNSSLVESLGGILTLSGEVANASIGTMAAADGSKLVVAKGLADNQGRISLTGGIFDNNGHALNNSGRISGYGTLRSGGLTNADNILLSGGSSTVDGAVVNNSGATFEVAHGHATFNDDVTNNGLFKTTNATVSFAGGFTNNGTYFSDPSTQVFTDLIVGSNGVLIGIEAGDVFQVSGNFLNYSTNNEGWHTDMAWLTFVTGAGNGEHVMSLAGTDLGASLAAYHDNFAWGQLDISGNSLNLFDGNSDAGGAFYVGAILGLDIESGLVSNIVGMDDLNIYYLAGLTDNAYLAGQDYALANGGRLIAVDGSAMPTPIPGAFWLFGSGLVGLAAWRRKKQGSLEFFRSLS